jgi:Xaa-Pro aminopeptidase
VTGWPVRADFAGPPTPVERTAWEEADRAARPARLERIRSRFSAAGVDAYFGVRREHMRYLTGFTLAEGEEKAAGHSGQFLVAGDEVVILADSRYTIQARQEAPGTRLFEAYQNLPSRWSELVASIGARRIAVEAGFVSQALWQRLARAEPDVELVPVEGWIEHDRAVKEPAELERVAAACAVADRALATLLPEIRPGITEATLALRLEWLIRTDGAEALAFDVACLSGAQAALPHGAPGDRPVQDGQVLLFDFGAQVAGYRSDMTRTLFVGEPSERDLDVYNLVARAQSAAIDALEAAVDGRAATGSSLPSGRSWHRAGHPRGTQPGQAGQRGAAAEPDRVLGGTRRLPGGRDGRPDRGPCPSRCRRGSDRAADPIPAGDHRRRGRQRRGSAATLSGHGCASVRSCGLPGPDACPARR